MKSLFLRIRAPLYRLASVVLDLGIAAAAFIASYSMAFGIERVRWVPGIEEKVAAFVVVCALSFQLFAVTRGSAPERSRATTITWDVPDSWVE